MSAKRRQGGARAPSGRSALLYARVSTTRQAEHDLSIPDQIAQLERYCRERGLAIAGSYIHAGASARDDNRPEFQRLIADLKSGLVSAELLLVHSFSRFFRDSYGFAFYSRALAKHGVTLVSATHEVGEDVSGQLIRNVLSAFDEYSSLETAKHVTRSMLENARRGFWNGSQAPFGYRTIIAERHGSKDKKKLAIEPREAEIVRLAFHLYLYGDGEKGPMGVKDVTSALNARRLSQRSGKPFRLQSVHLMLTRATYIGVHYFNRRDSRAGKPKPREHWIAVAAPRILEDDVFHAVQGQLKARHPRVIPARITNSKVLLTGIARCQACGGAMRTRTGKGGRYWYYACSRKADIGAVACAGAAIPMRRLDDLVTEAVLEQVLEPSRLEAMVGSLIARNARHQHRARAELRGLQLKQCALTSLIANLVDVLETGGLGAAQSVQERLAQRQEEAEKLSRLICVQAARLERALERCRNRQNRRLRRGRARAPHRPASAGFPPRLFARHALQHRRWPRRHHYHRAQGRARSSDRRRQPAACRRSAHFCG